MFTRAPVAISAFAELHLLLASAASPSAPPASSDITLVSVSSSTPFSSYQLGRVDVARPPRAALAPQVLLRERRPLVRARAAPARPAGSTPRPRAFAAPPRSAPPPCPRRSAGSRPCGRAHRPPTHRRSPSGPKYAFSSSSSPGSSTASTSSPGSSTVSGPGHEPRPLAQHRDQQAPLRQLEVADPLARHRRALAEQQLDDLEPLLRQVEQVDQPVLRAPRARSGAGSGRSPRPPGRSRAARTTACSAGCSPGR